MSSWRSYLSSSRYSPFTAQQATRPPPQVTEDDYHYLSPEDIVDPPRVTYAPRYAGGSRSDAANPLVPDILILKHKGTTYPLHFPAFAIGEGVLRVGELRKHAAKEMGNVDPRRLKLLYKGKMLKNDAVACREEGLKQNSELLCVVSVGPVDTGRDDESSESASESEMIAREGAMDSGVRFDLDDSIMDSRSKKSRKGHRGGSKKKRRDDGYLGVDGTSSGATNSRSDSPLPPSSQHTSSPPIQQQNLTSSNSSPAMAKLDELSSIFHTRFVPQCVQFTNNPPKDAKTRDFEYKKLSETILAQIILKLDEVVTEGNEEARARRKALVMETQAMLHTLDALVKK